MEQSEAQRSAAATDGRWPTRDEAWALMTEYVQSQSLRRHMLAVEAAMRAYARRFGEDEERWGVVALLHDFDYEIHPTLDQHPQDGAPILRERGYSEDLIHDILTHADHLELARETALQKTLYAVDEATGFASAVALVRPDKRIASVTPQSFKKKMKDKAFARAVSREDMLHGAELLGVPFEEHIEVIVEAMTGIADDLGLAGQEGA
ncbi:MAG TPA: HDIG domain-containing protein [Thermomicrobiales bacterium]|nr:HDIG domain-containing protein [Thermomicrobiales bacterium]